MIYAQQCALYVYVYRTFINVACTEELKALSELTVISDIRTNLHTYTFTVIIMDGLTKSGSWI